MSDEELGAQVPLAFRECPRLWRGLRLACWGDGHSRPTDLGALAMAERFTRRGLSVRSGGTALTTWLSLASGTFASCFTHMRSTTTGFVTHLSLHKDAPVPRKVQAVGRVLSLPMLGGLHHQYVRI
jgi:hypothetical protein